MYIYISTHYIVHIKLTWYANLNKAGKKKPSTCLTPTEEFISWGICFGFPFYTEAFLFMKLVNFQIATKKESETEK